MNSAWPLPMYGMPSADILDGAYPAGNGPPEYGPHSGGTNTHADAGVALTTMPARASVRVAPSEQSRAGPRRRDRCTRSVVLSMCGMAF